MDFEFTQYLGEVRAKCAMEQQAFAHWFNTEAAHNQALVQQILAQLAQNSQQPTQFIGREYSLFVEDDEVMVKANNLCSDELEADNLTVEEPLEQDFYYYDAESIAFCGIEDFCHFLSSYLDFLKG